MGCEIPAACCSTSEVRVHDPYGDRTGRRYLGNLICVIVPVCNAAPYLSRCIDSILAGTYEELEVILVDDASTDGSGEICDSYAVRDPRVRVLHTEKAGVAAARNSGLDLVKGDFIAFVDSDDYIHPETLSKLHQAIGESGASMSVCSYMYVNEGAGKKFDNKGIPKNDKIFRTDKILREELFKPYHTYWIALWAKLYRAELWSDIRFPVGKVFEDLYALPLIYMSCETCAYIGMTGYYYMQHAGSILNAMNPQKTANHIEGTFFWRNSTAEETTFGRQHISGCSGGCGSLSHSVRQESQNKEQSSVICMCVS